MPEIVADDGYSSLSESQLQTLLYEAAAANDANTTQALCQAGANPNEMVRWK